MSKPVSITDLLTAIGSENINFQVLAHSMENIKSKKGETVISFATDALTASDVANNSGPCGLILWLDGQRMDDCMQDLKAGNGLTYDKLLEQHNELLAALETIGAHTITEEDGDEVEVLFGDIGKIRRAIAKAKGGAA